jgi:hypothetical protein
MVVVVHSLQGTPFFFGWQNLRKFRRPNVNRPALAKLAVSSGGRLVELPDLPSIASSLKAEKKTIALHRQASIWDNWLVVLLLAMLYSLDIGLRRLAGLS